IPWKVMYSIQRIWINKWKKSQQYPRGYAGTNFLQNLVILSVGIATIGNFYVRPGKKPRLITTLSTPSSWSACIHQPVSDIDSLPESHKQKNPSKDGFSL
ncbi:uncharacterized protein METZ01_LOCUS463291, partial [marine metagenome]